MYADFFKMAENANPFFAEYTKIMADFDPKKMMADFDPKKMADEFAKVTKGYEMPKFDFDAVIELQKKNFDALTAANQVAAEGAQAFAKRQAEMLQQALEEVSKMIESFSKIDNPQAVAAVQADMLKGAFVKSVDNTRELADLMTKSNTEASDALNTRVVEALEEVKATVLKASKKK
jgi:phasin family protein